jgi:hypothetical protein
MAFQGRHYEKKKSYQNHVFHSLDSPSPTVSPNLNTMCVSFGKWPHIFHDFIDFPARNFKKLSKELTTILVSAGTVAVNDVTRQVKDIIKE